MCLCLLGIEIHYTSKFHYIKEGCCTRGHFRVCNKT